MHPWYGMGDKPEIRGLCIHMDSFDLRCESVSYICSNHVSHTGADSFAWNLSMIESSLSHNEVKSTVCRYSLGEAIQVHYIIKTN